MPKTIRARQRARNDRHKNHVLLRQNSQVPTKKTGSRRARAKAKTLLREAGG